MTTYTAWATDTEQADRLGAAWRVRPPRDAERCQGTLRNGSHCRSQAATIYEWPNVTIPLCAIHGHRFTPGSEDRAGILNETRYPPTPRERRESQRLNLPVHTLRRMSADALLAMCACGGCGDLWCTRSPSRSLVARRWHEQLTDAERDARGYRP